MSTAADPNWAVYDLDRLSRNLSIVRRMVGPAQNILAAIKGNAYGHGALPVARVLEREGVSAFMTASFREASHLRANGVRTPIVMFAGSLPEGIGEQVSAGLIPTIVDITGANAAAAVGTEDAPTPIYVKVDMGLGRLGIPTDEAESFLSALSEMSGLKVVGLYTHLPFADQTKYEWAKGRFKAFDNLLERLEHIGLLPSLTQARASSSVSVGITDKANSVCVGHLLFGLSPFANEPIDDVLGFENVLCEIGTQLVQVTEHHQGGDMVITGELRTRERKRIGVAPIGAANGVHRPVPGSNPNAIVRGRRVPIIAVSVEHLTLDLDEVSDAQVGERVLLLGGDDKVSIGLDELAGWFGLSSLDTVLAVSGRIHARYRGSV